MARSNFHPLFFRALVIEILFRLGFSLLLSIGLALLLAWGWSQSDQQHAQPPAHQLASAPDASEVIEAVE